MAWSFVQENAASSITSSPSNLSLPGNTTAGNAVFVAVTYRAAFGAPAISVSDDGSNTWTRDVHLEVQNDGTNYKYLDLYSTVVAAPGDEITVTFTSGSPQNGAIAILEYSGLATSSIFDIAASAAGNNSSPASGTTGATAAANELVLAVMGLTENSENQTSFSSSGYTERSSAMAFFDGAIWVADKDSGSAGATHSMSGSLNNTMRWGAITAVYKIAGGGGGPTGNPWYYRAQQ
jgi:hypothetical protein